MLELLRWIALLAVSLAGLVKGSDWFTEAAEKIGLWFGLPPFIIGVTIVAVGTSLPELLSSIAATWHGSSEVVLGNVVGSNIVNIFLIVGAAAIMTRRNINITYDLVDVDLPIFVGSGVWLYLIVQDGTFSIGEAILSLFGFLIYVIYIFQEGSTEVVVETETAEKIRSSRFPKKAIAKLVIGCLTMILGANYTIDSVREISEIIQVGQEIIAISIVAFGTSLPELVVSVTMAKKDKAEVAVGNVIGSNIFNSFFVMGIPGLAGTLVLAPSTIQNGLPLMLVGTILLFFVVQDKKVTAWEGWTFVMFYIWFVGHTFHFI
ncbi:calcium/sodium antiporter [Geitlerinema sp. PCC 9228]|uniref:calcium/sodium antiporter n=1 Tax=Geitlerinema sp. PCC 9228 TaxID=111611 RepID=UPI0008F9B0F1|nr:calcium/sodium antiporter [Geitlerinema sp. PCC 9228]